MNLFQVGESLFSGERLLLDVLHVAVFGMVGHNPAFEQLFHDNPTGNDGQVSRQAALTAKAPQRRIVVGENRDENLRRQVLQVVRRNSDRPRRGSMLNHVDDQTQKSIDEILPRVWLSSQ